MKKIFVFVFSILLCFSFILGASAEYTIGSDGNAKADTAVGYTFRIDKVNKSITGEDSSAITTSEALGTVTSQWAVYFIAQKAQGNVYAVVGDAVLLAGNPHNAKLSEGQVAFFFHSSTSNPDKAADYPNWEDRVNAAAVKDGNYLVLEGVDLHTGVVSGGKLTVYADKDSAIQAAGNAEESSAADTSSAASEGSADASSVSEAGKNNSVVRIDDISGIKTTEAPIGDSFPWVWVISSGVAVVIIIVVVIIIRKKK